MSEGKHKFNYRFNMKDGKPHCCSPENKELPFTQTQFDMRIVACLDAMRNVPPFAESKFVNVVENLVRKSCANCWSTKCDQCEIFPIKRFVEVKE